MKRKIVTSLALNGISILLLTQSPAADLTVNTTADEFDTPSGSDLSLREAIRDANPSGDTIWFAPALSGLAIKLSDGQLTIDKSIRIDASALDEPITIDADGETTGSRVLECTPGSSASIDSLILTGGRSPGSEAGGGILNRGSLEIERCQIIGNATSARQDGPGGDGGGIFSDGTLVMVDSVVADNATSHANQGYPGQGGGIYNSGMMSLTGCQILKNHTGGGDQGGAGGGICNFGSQSENPPGGLTLNRCLVADNYTAAGAFLSFGIEQALGTDPLASDAGSTKNLRATLASTPSVTFG